MTSDRIEQEIVIDAPVERVWSVLTDPGYVGKWFGQGEPIRIDLRPGGFMHLDHGEYGIFPCRIEKVDPPNLLVYRWASAYPGDEATDSNSTLVEFTLTPDGEATRLRVVESGFAALTIPPARQSTASYESHTKGWPEVLGNLRRYAEQPDA